MSVVEAWRRGYLRGTWNGLQLGAILMLLFMMIVQECQS